MSGERRPLLGPWTEVRRPWAAAILALAALGAAGLACTGFFRLTQTARGEPMTIVSAKEELADALNDAPWVETGGAGPVVWVVDTPACAECALFHQRDLPALEAGGLRVRVIMVSPRTGRHPRLDGWVAAFAENRDPAMLAPLKAGRAPPTAPPDDAAEIEGHLEWGRASAERVAAVLARNGGRMRYPALFWRYGPEWRAAIGREEALAPYVLRDLAPGA